MARPVATRAAGSRRANREINRAHLFGLGWVLALSVGGCHPGSVSSTAPRASAAPLHQGPLTDFVPAAGLRWMLAGSPRELARNPELLSEVQRIVSKGRLDAFATSSGIDLRELPEGCIAGFDYGTLYLARVGSNNSLVRKRFEARLVTDPVVHSSRNDLWRVTGLVANTPESLLTVSDDFAAIAVGDPLLARVVEAFATGRFKKSKPALAGAALASLPGDLADAPMRFYAPGPFTDEWARAADGVLARALAFGASASLPSPSVLQIRLVVSGEFGPDLDKTRNRLLATWSNLQASTIGHLLRLGETLEPATVTVQGETAVLSVSFAISTLIQGVSAAVIDDINQIMGSLPPDVSAPAQSR